MLDVLGESREEPVPPTRSLRMPEEKVQVHPRFRGVVALLLAGFGGVEM